MAFELARNEEGQAFTEYIVLVAVVVGVYAMTSAALVRMGLAKKMVAPIQTTFAAAYRYGHTQAKGYDDGGPVNHPRADTDGSNNNLRLFYNPEF